MGLRQGFVFGAVLNIVCILALSAVQIHADPASSTTEPPTTTTPVEPTTTTTPPDTTTVPPPAAPGNLNVTDQNTSSIAVAWDLADEGTVDDYQCCIEQIDGDEGIANCLVPPVLGRENTATFPGLTAGRNYNISVVARKDGQNSTAATTSDGTNPSKVQNLQTSTTETSITVSWTQGDGGITHYKICIAEPVGIDCHDDIEEDSTIFNEDDDIEPGTIYDISVVAYNDMLPSIPAYTNATTVPTKPENLHVVGQDTGSITVTWNSTDEGKVDEYDCCITPDIDDDPQCTPVEAPDNTTTFAGLTAGTNHTINVTAVKNAERSEPAEITDAGTNPSKPNVTDRITNETSISISWTQNDGGATHYDVCIVNPELCHEGIVEESTIFDEEDGIEPGTVYEISVVAYNGILESVPVKETAVTVPTQPQNLTVVGQSTTSITVEWDHMETDKVDEYECCIEQIDGDREVNYCKPEGSPATTSTFTSLVPGWNYKINVTALKAGTPSQPAEIERAATIPATPVELQVEYQTTDEIKINWSHGSAEGEADFTCCILSLHELSDIDDCFSTTEKELTFTDLMPGLNYSISVTACQNNLPSEEAELPSEGTYPSQPNVTDIETTESEINITWIKGIGGVSHYNTCITNDALDYTSCQVTDTEPDSEEPLIDIFSGVPSGEVYAVIVTAFNGPLANGTEQTEAITFPSAPTDLRVSEQSTNHLNVAWNYDDDEATFTSCILPENSNIGVCETNIKVTNHIFGNLEPGINHYINVTAQKNGLDSEPDELDSVATIPAKPELQVDYRSTDEIKIIWTHDSLEDEANFICCIVSLDELYEADYCHDTTEMEWTFTDLVAGINYKINATAWQNDLPSEEAVLPSEGTYPNPPVIGEVTVTKYTITVPWAPGEGGFTNFSVCIEESNCQGKAAYPFQVEFDAGDGVLPGTEYDITVTAFNGEDLSSAPSTKTEITDLDEPTISNIVPGEATLEVTFTPPDGDYDHVTVTCSAISSSAKEDSDTVAKGENKGTCENLTAGAHYNVVLQTHQGDDRESDTVDEEAVSIPKQPQVEVISHGIDNITLSLEYETEEDVAQCTHYEIDWGEESDDILCTELIYTIDPLDPNTKYEIEIRTVSNYGSAQLTQKSGDVPVEQYTRPEPVSDITEREKGSESLTVQWTPPAGPGDLFYVMLVYEQTDGDCVGHYLLHVGDDPDYVEDMPDSCPDKGTAEYESDESDLYFEVTGLDIYTEYRFRIFAHNRDGMGDSADSDTFRTDEAVLTDQVDVTSISDITFHSMVVEWTLPDDPKGHITKCIITIAYDLCPDGPSEEILQEVPCDSDDTDQTYNHTIVGLEAYTDYTITVEAHNGKGAGDSASDPEEITTDTTKPETPADFDVDPASISHDSAQVMWEELSECDYNGTAAGYRIHCIANDLVEEHGCDDRSEINDTINESTTVSHDLTLEPYTQYECTISAVNIQEGESEPSEPITFNSKQTAPGSVRNLVIESPTHDELKVEWNEPECHNGILTMYNVSWKIQSDASNEDSQGYEELLPNETSYLIEGLIANRNYLVRVQACTLPEECSSLSRVERTGVSPPYPPQNVRARAEGPRNVTVEWDRPPDERYTGPTNYTVTLTDADPQCDPENRACAFDKTVAGFYTSNATIEDDAMTPYWEYSVSVMAFTETGEETADGDSVITHGSEPLKVQDLKISSLQEENSCSKMRVEWRDPECRDRHGTISGYHISYQHDQNEAEEWEKSVELSDCEKKTEDSECGHSNACSILIDKNIDPNNIEHDFTVYAKTHNHNGEVSTGSESSGRCASQVPESNNTAQREHCPDCDEHTQFKVRLEGEHLRNVENGQPTLVGIIVAQQAGDGKYYREDNEEDDSDIQYYTMEELSDIYPPWGRIAGRDVMPAYRATDDSWQPEDPDPESRKRRAAYDEVIEIIGNMPCEGQDRDEYCNGPVNSGGTYKVRTVSCTQFECSVARYSVQTFVTVEVETGTPDWLIALSVILSLLVLALVVLVLAYFARRWDMWPFKQETAHTHHTDHPTDTDLHQIEPKKTTNCIRISDFTTYIKDMHRDSDLKFSDEYKDLKDTSPQKENSASELPQNRTKNRYTNILAFDETRVKLLPTDDDEGSDYINANYMIGYNSKREFIAAQGPLPATVDDFWRMIWEQNVPMIVMLTNCFERGREKCSQYWPNDSEPLYYGDLQVQTRSESVLDNYTIRILDVQLGEETRAVEQYHFTNWPDFGCPSTTDALLNFVQTIRNRIRPNFRGPVMVHCSAGVGRTGTLIAVDHLLQYIREHDHLDIYGLVLKMRNYRNNMVQTEDQYIFIHDCMKDAIEKGMHLGVDNQALYYNEVQQESEEGNIYENTTFIDEQYK